MTFKLHPKLAKDSLHLANLKLCQLRLINDQRFYWLLLIPKIADVSELHDLSSTDHQQLWQEVHFLSQVIKPLTKADKLNVATLGNLVPQLHLHLIARFTSDTAWPNPVWGSGTAEPYGLAAVKSITEELQLACSNSSLNLPIDWQKIDN
ncbi:MAG TPA: HIT family protein [Marinospirillum sp.]|uniref:HIT family protein n=1 Tax=Marinospirillum sp. TaxID=2183934 RepID=UPI002B4877E6|nr:HIT family protein [Marinospirillum sp.]HKM15348.1 HIT family protein [Marinospirillum sp.]